MPFIAAPQFFTATDKADQGTPSAAYNRMLNRWRPILPLLGGTQAMRDESTTYLPRFPRETDRSYRWRLGQAFLHEYYADTVGSLLAKPFSRPVTWDRELVPEQLVPVLDNLDGAGSTLHSFAEQTFFDGVVFGKCHALVDFTTLIGAEDPARGPPEFISRGLEQDMGARPTVIRVSPLDLIAFPWIGEGSERRLSSIRMWKMTEEPDPENPYAEVQVIRILEYGRTEIRLWRRIRAEGLARTDWQLERSAVNTLGEVPLVTKYFRRSGWQESEPPLGALAWVNLDHWQSYAEQRQILSVVRVPMLVRRGVSPDEAREDLTVSINQVTTLVSRDSDLWWNEHTGAGAESGFRHLELLDKTAEDLGHQPLSRIAVTATAEVKSDAKSTTLLQKWAQEHPSFLRESVALAARWQRIEIPEDLVFDVFDDFDIGRRSQQNLGLLQRDRAARNITKPTYLREAQRNGLYGEDLDIDAEVAATDAEVEDMMSEFDDDPVDSGRRADDDADNE